MRQHTQMAWFLVVVVNKCLLLVGKNCFYPPYFKEFLVLL